MKNFRTFNLAVTFYHQSRTLPLKGNLKDQMERAASSIALNLAEGYGKPNGKDQNRFYNIAMGSTRECQGILILLGAKNTEAWSSLDNVAASLYRLIKSAG